MMAQAAREHPQYGWDRNKGYGTPDHLEALRQHGPCPLHRRSFAPVAQLELF
jgi:ribonuclease HII